MKKILLFICVLLVPVMSVSAGCDGPCEGGGGGVSVGPGGYSSGVNYFSMSLEDFFRMQGNLSLYFQMYQTYLHSLHP